MLPHVPDRNNGMYPRVLWEGSEMFDRPHSDAPQSPVDTHWWCQCSLGADEHQREDITAFLCISCQQSQTDPLWIRTSWRKYKWKKDVWQQTTDPSPGEGFISYCSRCFSTCDVIVSNSQRTTGLVSTVNIKLNLSTLIQDNILVLTVYVVLSQPGLVLQMRLEFRTTTSPVHSSRPSLILTISSHVLNGQGPIPSYNSGAPPKPSVSGSFTCTCFGQELSIF